MAMGLLPEPDPELVIVQHHFKQALEESAVNDLDSQLDLERDLQAEAAATPDHAEGLRAFLAKRAPAFGGGRS